MGIRAVVCLVRKLNGVDVNVSDDFTNVVVDRKGDCWRLLAIAGYCQGDRKGDCWLFILPLWSLTPLDISNAYF